MVSSKEEAMAVVEEVLDLSLAEHTEVLFTGGRTALTRYANSIIHQNVASRDSYLVIRLVYDKRLGVVKTNRTDKESLKEALEQGARIARAQRPNKDFISLPEASKPRDVQNFSAKTDRSTPEDRAEVVKDIVSIVSSEGVDKAFGALEATTRIVAVANTLGIQVQDELTYGHLVVTAIREVDHEKGYGWGEEFGVDISKLDHRGMAERAAEKAKGSLGAKAVEPGEYEVVLEGYAVADMVQFLGYITFGALAYQEGRSYVSGRLGQKLTEESITLWDEGTRPDGLPLPFDSEGVPKDKVTLLGNGIAKGVVYDSYTAGREGLRSTGHALPSLTAMGFPNTIGPVAGNTFLERGDSSIEEMVKETRRGIYVTRFHYTNPVDASKALITGMTRDGTFLIQDGEITGPVKNLRFTQGLMEAFSQASLLGRDWRPYRLSPWLGLGALTVPDAKIDRFRFTGVTEF